MGLSSDTLIQQTNFRNLKKILNEKAFRVSYCEEHFNHGTPEEPENTYIHVFPMICFSEIPISSLHNHLYRYGDCIIGMSQRWAIANGLNQVHYYQQASILTESLFETYHYYYSKVGGQEIQNSPLYEEYMKIFYHLEYQVAFSKNYSGTVSSERYKDDNYIFAEEKEWRFVPVNEYDDRPLSLIPDEFRNNKTRYQNEIGAKKLRFNLKDINYIVVETDIQKINVRDFLTSKDSQIHINIFTNSEITQRFFGYKNPSIREYDMQEEIDSLKNQTNS